MRAWLGRLRERWQNWCGDREMELAIRQHLGKRGFYGGAAKLRNVRVIAIERPGWLQIYRFEAAVRRVRDSVEDAEDYAAADERPEEVLIYGLVVDDGRKGSEVHTFMNARDRYLFFSERAAGMIQLRGSFLST